VPAAVTLIVESRRGRIVSATLPANGRYPKLKLQPRILVSSHAGNFYRGATAKSFQELA
jgi:hypothetical protein